MITDSKIAWGDSLGAQMMKIAQLYYIAKKNNQKIVFWGELINFRRKYLFVDAFSMKDIKIIYRTRAKMIVDLFGFSGYMSDWKSEMNRIYNIKIIQYIDKILYKFVKMFYRDFITLNNMGMGIFSNNKLLQLNVDMNYDISDGFGTYREWGVYKHEIVKMFNFRKKYVLEGKKIYNSWGNSKKYKVAVHFRRTDYLLLSSLNLDNEYYSKAMEMFDVENTTFMVFSDDIDEVKKLDLFKGKDVFFVENHSAPVDMYLMSLCDGNIIANSTFSFWAAMLNKNEDKKVICPRNYIGKSSPEYMCMNGNWYPEEWTAI